jgi:hypothetical protein
LSLVAPGGLEHVLLDAVRQQGFAETADRWLAGRPVEAFPSIDLAVAAFPRGQPALWANVLFSREHPEGHGAGIGPAAGPVQNLRFDRDLRDAQLDSAAWLPGADWSRLPWQILWGDGPVRFVAPYPASLLKLMVAVGVALAVDEGLLAGWPEALEAMITVSDNAATDACVALLHQAGVLPAALNRRFAAWGLPTLQIHGTTAAGGWRNADGAGVGQIHMTAWDTVRLLWLLDDAAPAPPWLPHPLPAAAALPSLASRARIQAVLRRPQLDEVLSSASLRGLPGWVPGLPGAPDFAHKTGTTDNYASDAGILRLSAAAAGAEGCDHAIVAMLSSLGRRYAPDERCATTWRIPALGGAILRWMTAPAGMRCRQNGGSDTPGAAPS